MRSALQGLLESVKPIKPQGMGACCHLCIEGIHLRLQVVPLVVDLTQLASLLHFSQEAHIFLRACSRSDGCMSPVKPI